MNPNLMTEAPSVTLRATMLDGRTYEGRSRTFRCQGDLSALHRMAGENPLPLFRAASEGEAPELVPLRWSLFLIWRALRREVAALPDWPEFEEGVADAKVDEPEPGEMAVADVDPTTRAAPVSPAALST